MVENLPITTFFGPDAIGKTTLAILCAEEATARGLEAEVFGSSNYKEWLTDRSCRELLGYPLPNTTVLDTTEKEVFYEDLAIAGYLYGDDLRKQGKIVIIDSDPYLKRLVWARHQIMDDQEFIAYADKFEQKVQDGLGKFLFSDFIIEVATGESSLEEAARITEERIARRKDNSEYDPDGLEANISIHTACKRVWDSIIYARRYPRIAQATTTQVTNKHCERRAQNSLHEGITEFVLGRVLKATDE